MSATTAQNKRKRDAEDDDDSAAERDLIGEQLSAYMQVKNRLSRTRSNRIGFDIADATHEINIAFGKLQIEECRIFEKNVEGVMLYVDGQPAGTLTSPDVAKLLALAAPAPFGHGAQTVYDETVRKALEIAASRIEFRRTRPDSIRRGDATEVTYPFTDFVDRELLPIGTVAEPSLYKLHIYEKGGHFDWHADTQHGKDHFASAVVILGSRYAGGDLLVKTRYVENEKEKEEDEEEDNEKDDDKEKEQEKDEKDVVRIRQSDEPNRCTVAWWYTDCLHCVEPVTEGTRIVLQFDLKMASDDEGSAQLHERLHAGSHELNVSEMALQSVCDKVASYCAAFDDKDGDNKHDAIAFLLRHLYINASLIPSRLKGIDRQLYDAFHASKHKFRVSLEHMLLNRVDGGENGREHFSFSSMEPLYKHVRLFLGCSPVEGGTCLQYSPFIFYTGNDAQDGESTYHYAALIIERDQSGESGREEEHDQNGENEREEKKEETPKASEKQKNTSENE